MAKVKFHPAETPEATEGYSFYCPGCEHTHFFYTKNGGPDREWQFNGDNDKPTFKPSLLNRAYRKNPDTGNYDIETDRCHLFVTDGKIQFLGDCAHKLAGQTVEMQEL